MKTSLDISSVNVEEICKSKIKQNLIVKGKNLMLLGAYSLSVPEIINVFYSKITGAATTYYGANVENVIFKVRMPRIFAAILILTGIVIASLCQAFISIIKYVGDPEDKLPQITFWLMGGLSTVTERDVLIMIIPMLIGIIPLFISRWRLNVLSFGDEEAG